jgi:prolyl oligopeptidase PreP (S9A serine peptidase family)
MIPYFVIHHKDLVYDSTNPTLLYGYGGFDISLFPQYLGIIGSTWFNPRYNNNTNKTVYVIANLRGGGEYGSEWHNQAIQENRYKVYDDFIAVATDLISIKHITQSSILAIRGGGANGGLLMGMMYVTQPELFAAIYGAIPLLDMRRYLSLLSLTGTSATSSSSHWIAEYGDPDEAWQKYLQFYSPYHHIDIERVQSKEYPALLFTTSTYDKQVHPYHARSFVKRLLDTQYEYTISNNTSEIPSHDSSSSSCSSSIEKIGTVGIHRRNSFQCRHPRHDNHQSMIGRGDVLYYENMDNGGDDSSSGARSSISSTPSSGKDSSGGGGSVRGGGGGKGGADSKQQAFMNVSIILLLS